jgi:hypothetical protein
MLAVRVLREDGTEANYYELGRIACKLPLPPGTMSTLYEASERFKKTYFSKYAVNQQHKYLYISVINIFFPRASTTQWTQVIWMSLVMFTSQLGMMTS